MPTETLGALASVLSIWVVTGVLVYLASARIINNDYEIEARAMLATSAGAVAVNLMYVPQPQPHLPLPAHSSPTPHCLPHAHPSTPTACPHLPCAPCSHPQPWQPPLPSPVPAHSGLQSAVSPPCPPRVSPLAPLHANPCCRGQLVLGAPARAVPTCYVWGRACRAGHGGGELTPLHGL